jgi:hypothetical protein
MLKNVSVTADIFEISPVTLYRVKTCCDIINRNCFVNPDMFDRFARAAFNSVMSDIGNFAPISANTHALFCHGSYFIKYYQEELGVSVGSLSENAIEMGNKLNLQYRKLFSMGGNIVEENYNIFNRWLMITDPYLVMEGVLQQKLRRGNVRKFKKRKVKKVKIE